jgi:antirestriction protein ArdC
MSKRKKKDVYEIVNSRIIEALEQGVVPWRKPWAVKGEAGIPVNAHTEKQYNGFNIWNLQIIALLEGYTTNKWMTRRQAGQHGGSVKKGEKYHPVVYWNFVEKERKDLEGNTVTDDSGKPIIDKIPFLRFYQVYNLDQIEGIDYESDDIDTDTLDFEPIEEAEKLWNGYSDSPELTHSGARAYYNPSADKIRMPETKWFESEEEYYSTLFHEGIHSTGHKSRLARKELMDTAAFDTETYSKEELTAEFGSAFLCGLAGIENKTVDNSAAYINNWLEKIRENKRWLVSAAGKAQKAVDYILGE